ncbi:hypothetical protein DPMN_020353 [Dreissena polymorpha]|uniref:Uncharacterized protein n=1 Tax=Dreissena polymorpha TaxID=45954 RepID=A0A9D4NIP6_DREPO|nr:hypothetical protein DPMN_020353 [Dreissena polymorpha]
MPAKFGPTLLSALAFNPVRSGRSTQNNTTLPYFFYLDHRRCRNGSLALPELSSNWFTSPAEVTGHHKLYSITDSETALNTRPVVSRGSVSLQITRN